MYETTPHGTAVVPPAASYVSWGAISAGAVLACAISVILVQFGSAVGLSAASPYISPENQITAGAVVAAGLWLLWVQVISSLTGGYIAGRLRAPLAEVSEHEKDVRDGAHGLIVWAVGTIAVTIAVGTVSALTALADPAPNVEQTAEMMRMSKNATVIFAFTTAAASLISAVASWWAATMGGDHRDKSPDYSKHFSFRFK